MEEIYRFHDNPCTQKNASARQSLTPKRGGKKPEKRKSIGTLIDADFR
jgi:hypothetical protein